MAKHDRSRKLSTGPNARPKNESIAQSGGGIPDDTGAGNPDLADEAARMEDPRKQVFKRSGDKPVSAGKPRPAEKPKPAAPGRVGHQDPAEGDREAVERELQRQSDKPRKR